MKKLFLLLLLSFCLNNSVIFAADSTVGKKLELPKITDKVEQRIKYLYKNKSGFGLGSGEYEKIVEQGGAPTYGEITYEASKTLLKDLKLTRKDVFYDLGCGVGKFVVQAYLSSPVKKSVGIELSAHRVNQAQEVKEHLINSKEIRRGKKLEFYEENITKSNLNDATVVFMCATCFSKTLMNKMTEKLSKLKKGLRVVTLKQLPEHKKFALVKEYTLPMTWSDNSTVYLYRLKS